MKKPDYYAIVGREKGRAFRHQLAATTVSWQHDYTNPNFVFIRISGRVEKSTYRPKLNTRRHK